MTDTPKPLTADEIADLLAKAKDAMQVGWLSEGMWTLRLSKEERVHAPLIAAANPETILRLIATIERRDEQIEKLRNLLIFINRGIGGGIIKDQTILLPCAPDAEEQPLQALSDAIDEALAATEPKP